MKENKKEVFNFIKNKLLLYKNTLRGLPCGPMDETAPAHAGNTGSIPGPGRSHM